MNSVKKVLIAIDDGPASEKIAANAFQFARQLNAEIALVSIVDPRALIVEGSMTPQELTKKVKADHKRIQEMLAEKVFKNYKIWTFVEEGNPYEEILRVAEEWEADLIVLGTHGRTGLSHLFVGSVAEKVTRHSTKPVLIIPVKT